MKDRTSARRLGSALAEADAVVIGAGAGLSASAGMIYTGERFEKYFADFRRKYGFRDMYSGGFYPYDTLEEYWAYWSRYIWINRYMDPPEPVYENLYRLVKDKDYFVLTTNARRKDKDLRTLMRYARLFRVEKILRQYLEVLL